MIASRMAVCASATLLMAVAGCADIHLPRPSVVKTDAEHGLMVDDVRADLSRGGTFPVTRDSVEVINLLFLIDPDGQTQRDWEARKHTRTWPELTLSEQYDLAFAQFTQRFAGADRKSQRDLVQNRLIMASERRCGRYVQYLKKEQADRNFQFGIATTLLAGAGALVPGIRASQNLAGSAAMVSGVRAEYNNEYFANLAVSVITRGIAQRRGAELQQLQLKQRQQYERYDIAAAVADAVHYDAQCNVVVGLEEANEAISKVAEPGADAINRALVRSQLTRALATGDSNHLKSLVDSLGALGVDTGPLVSGLVYAPTNGPLAFDSGRVQANGVPTDPSVGADLYGDVLRTRKRIDEMLATVPATVSATMAEWKNSRGKDWTVSDQIVQTLITNAQLQSKSLTDGFHKDFLGVQNADANSCVAEAKAIADRILDASTKLRDAEVELRINADGRPVEELEDTVRRMRDGLAREAELAGRLEQKLLRYRRAVDESVSSAVRNLRATPQSELTADSFTLPTWGDVDAKKIGASQRCTNKPLKLS